MHTFQAQPARLQTWTDSAPLWDFPQLATSNQPRGGPTINEQVSLKLNVRLQRLQGKPWHAKTRPKLPKALPIAACQNTVF